MTNSVYQTVIVGGGFAGLFTTLHLRHEYYPRSVSHGLKPANDNLRGTLLKLGLEDGVANLFNKIEIDGEAGHLIRQGTYLELLPTPLHNFKATNEWLEDEIFERHHSDGVKQAVKVAELVGGIVVGAIVARKLVKALSKDQSR